MKITSQANSLHELQLLKGHGITDVLLGLRELSRFGNLDLRLLNEMAIQTRNLGMRPILEWDVLMTNDRMIHAKKTLALIDLGLFSAIRVQDSGALHVSKKMFPDLPIQLILETGNHNLEGVKRWCDSVGNQLERVILSNELAGTTLAHYIKNLSVPVEVLGLGPILIFYTPRYLLSFQKKDLNWLSQETSVNTHRVEALAHAEEGFHKGFRLLENQHGTFMFHAKDYCLIDRLDQLFEMNLDTIRIDLKMNGDQSALPAVTKLIDKANRLQFESLLADRFIASYPNKVTRCFFQKNATDVIFKKLTNEHIVRNDDHFVGEVVEVAKDRYLLIHVQSNRLNLKREQSYSFSTPEGKVKEVLISKISDLDRNEIMEAVKNDFVIIPYQKSITPKTIITLTLN